MSGLEIIKNENLTKIKKYNPINYFTFGKFMIHKKLLLDKNILLCKYPISYAPVPKVKRQIITNNLKIFLIDLIDTGKLNINLQKNLNDMDVELFENLLKLSGLIKQLNYKREYKTVEDYMDRFYILQGSVNAGNQNEKIINELMDIIDLLSNKTINRISQEDAAMLKECLT